MKKLIFIELNEINFDLIKKYSKKIKFNFFNKSFLSNLKTSSSEKIYENIEPWIQWVSIHTNKTASEHKVKRLGDINKFKGKQIFELIEDMGYSVGAICPMNTLNKMKNPKYFISDPWTHNKESKNFFTRVLTQALKNLINNNSNNKFFFGSYIVLFLSLLKIVRIKTIPNYFYYFFQSLKNKWNKALFLDLFLNEFHIYCIKKFNPEFTTIFFNAGAHIQHHYLLNSKLIKNNFLLPKWCIKEKKDPIEEMYLFYDKVLSEYNNMKQYQLLIVTGLTQKPYNRVKYYYRPIDHKLFLENFLIEAKSIKPRMTRDFLIDFNQIQQCSKVANILKKTNEINKEDIFKYDNRGTSIFITFAYNKEIHDKTYIYNVERKKVFLKKLVSFVAIKNGMHDQKGFVSMSDNLNKFSPKKIGHVKNIYKLIENYFKYNFEQQKS